MRLVSRRAQRASESGAALPEVVLIEATELGWMTVLYGSVVQVLHAAAKLQASGATAELDRAGDEPEFHLDDLLPTTTLASEIPSATPRGPARFGETVLGRTVRTYRDVDDLCRHLGLVSRAVDGTWRVHTPLPAPPEVLPLEEEELAFHDHRRWRAQLPPTLRAMVLTFRDAADGRHAQLPFDRGADRLSCTASLYWWCQRTDAHPEAVRQAALALVTDRGFSASPPPEGLYWDEPFSLAADRTTVARAASSPTHEPAPPDEWRDADR